MSAVAGPSSTTTGPGQATLTGQSSDARPSGASPPSSLSGSLPRALGSNTHATMLASLSPSSPSFPPTGGTNTTTASSSSWFGRSNNNNNSLSYQHNQSIAPSQPSPRAVPTTASTSVMTTGSTHHHQGPILHPNLPSPPSSPEQTAQARAALVGTISNLLDTELQGRASLLHANAKALEKQERDVAKATEALRKETDKLVKVVKQGSEKVREAGDVQNWAEVLERDFLVLEDTLRRVRRGSGGCSDPDCSGCSCSGGSGSSWSGSRTPSRRGIFDEAEDGDRDGALGKGKGVEDVVAPSSDGESGIKVLPDGGAGEEVKAAGDQQEGSFASVTNAIAASISEAMATSIDDRPSLPSASSATGSGSVLPSGSTTVVADVHDHKGKGVFSTGDVTASSSSFMELDGDCEDERRKEDDFAASPSLEDRDIAGFAGLALQAEQEDGVFHQLGGEAQAAPEIAEHDPHAIEPACSEGSNGVEDKMDIDVPSVVTSLGTEGEPHSSAQGKDDSAKSEERTGI
ncbi:hypothetical protein PFICI_08760 [Pestalotiopsis fici W106-1]|uniref:Biogenesis of lysosome-related organelles complex 1 subunit 1 n=1 Tax=Pestalotiopsis fici (strain W106-1 / CGMCC3.15140) TaxID=1229662 RepID=W3X0L4_PESFW|nr:uncharacterized protein PFICI_08760 [Pestalotiopsis fici W106-1]ETS78907.1 hypothetical protein PFICI_08760 [Pestalotiopsis fici W106-1]